MTNRKIFISSPPPLWGTSPQGGNGLRGATTPLRQGVDGFPYQFFLFLGGDVNKVDRRVINKIIKFINFTNNQQDQK